MHPDAQNPDHIYKPWIFPYQQLRFGYTLIGGVSELSFGYVSDLKHLGLSRLTGIPLPGQIAFELLTLPIGQVVQATKVPNGQDGMAIISFVGAQYERHITNLFGLFGGYFRSFPVNLSTCQPPDQCSTPTGPTNYYQIGFYAQFPKVPPSDGLNPYVSRRSGNKNVTLFIGPTFSSPSSGTSPGALARVTVDLWNGRGRKKFGNPPPY